MAAFNLRHPANVVGKFFVDAQCLDCDLCRETAPNNFRRDAPQGRSYVFRQPSTSEELAQCLESVDGCPHEAIGNDGDQLDWEACPAAPLGKPIHPLPSE
jgi:ferredoxin